MLLHTIVATDEVMLENSLPQIEMRRLDGRLLECERIGADYRVRRLISTDPRDYLNTRFFPTAMFDKFGIDI